MASEFPPLFLGLDSSTQTLKATVVDETLKEYPEFEFLVNFDADLPEFKTKGGVFHGSDGLSVTTPTIVWIAALDLLLEKMKAKNFPFGSVVAISGSGQQHGSVYWKKGALQILQSLDPKLHLQLQAQDFFSVPNSPVWMDSSTTKQCKELESLMGSSEKVAQLTGSVAYERFTVNQIRKVFETQTEAYALTERISLVSSFVCSLLIGDYAPIDAGDASGLCCFILTLPGMNLMSLRTKEWIKEVVEWAAPELEKKLGKVALAHTIAGSISKFLSSFAHEQGGYFVERYGFSKDCSVVTFSGDNPCSVAGLRMREGDIAISLGTSDTMFGPLVHPNPSSEGHVFCDPVHPEGYMALLCYKNGSLTREHIRDLYAKKEWSQFNEQMEQTPPGNEGNIGFYFKEAEITPRANVGTHKFDARDQKVHEFERSESNVRAVVEGQFLSMLVHSHNIGLNTARIVATGGASKNPHILQTMANVFGVPVLTHSTPNSACLGAAYRALHGWKSKENLVSFDDLMQQATPFTEVAQPNVQAHGEYKLLAERYKSLEQTVIAHSH